MSHPMKLACSAAALTAFLVLTACGQSAPTRLQINNANVGERVVTNEGGISRQDETGILLGDNKDSRVKVGTRDHWDPLYDSNQQARFLEMRCLKLGRALALLESEFAPKRETAREDLAQIQNTDLRQTINWQTANPGKPVQGLVIPRYIGEELAKPLAQQDVAWLARHGRLLQEAYRLEELNAAVWREVRINMMREGEDGRDFLAANMVRRLALPNPALVREAQVTLADFVAAESIPYLVAATFVDLPTSTGVFPKRTAETLALIGPPAVDEILKVWQRPDGSFLPVNDESYRVRRYFAQTLGFIGDARSLDVLTKDLEQSNFKNDTARFIYEQVLIEALGDIKNPASLVVIKKVWSRYVDANDFAMNNVAVGAVRKITGKTVAMPDEIVIK